MTTDGLARAGLRSALGFLECSPVAATRPLHLVRPPLCRIVTFPFSSRPRRCDGSRDTVDEARGHCLATVTPGTAPEPGFQFSITEKTVHRPARPIPVGSGVVSGACRFE